MLAAIIQNLQNQPQPEVRPSTIHVDRGVGGPSWPRYEIVDIIAAIAAFQEVSGEHPVARAARRHRWIGEALPGIKEARDKREAAVFLAGAQLGAAAEREAGIEVTKAEADARERNEALAEKCSIEQMIKIVDEVRGTVASPARLSCGRGNSSNTGGGATLVIGLLVGVVLGATIVGSQRWRH